MSKYKTSLGYYSFSPKELCNLFGTGYKSIDLTNPTIQYKLEIIREEQQKNDIFPTNKYYDNPRWAEFPVDNFPIPAHGKKKLEYFIKEVGDELSKSWQQKLERFLSRSTMLAKAIPVLSIHEIIFTPGWVKYPHSEKSVQIGVPPGLGEDEKVIIIDTETFVRGFPVIPENPDLMGFAAPVIAIATTNEAHYIWMHSNFQEDRLHLPWTVELVPLPEDGKERLLLAFRSDYDCLRILNSYDPNTKYVWMDLYSMHIARHGYSEDQRKASASIMKKRGNSHFYLPNWVKQGANASLIEAYNFYCSEVGFPSLTKASKQSRDIFVKMNSLRELWDDREEAVLYAHQDSVVTYRLAAYVVRDYLHNLGLSATLYSHGVIASSPLPIDKKTWDDFLVHSERTYQEKMARQSTIFDSLADDLVNDYLDGFLSEEEIQSDPFYQYFNWAQGGVKTRTRYKYYHAFDEAGNCLNPGALLELIEGQTRVKDLLAKLQSDPNGKYKTATKLKIADKREEFHYSKDWGFPAWYSPKILSENDSLELTNKTRMAHRLLRLHYKGSPCVFRDGSGWCNLAGEKLPHKKGVDLNVGSILSQDFAKLFKEGLITSDLHQDVLAEVFEIAEATAYWTSARTRAANVYVHTNNLMASSYIPHQTVTTRSGSVLWSTVPNPKPHKIGSDFKTLIRARPGYKVVGTDFKAA